MARIGTVPVRVAMLETPAGFQPNAHAVYQKIGEFLEKSLQNYHPHIEYVQAHRKETARRMPKRSHSPPDTRSCCSRLTISSQGRAAPPTPPATCKPLVLSTCWLKLTGGVQPSFYPAPQP